MTQPTGVFVRLPLCEERAITFHKESSHAWDEFNGSSNALACEAGLLAIGTPVTGGAVAYCAQIIWYKDEDEPEIAAWRTSDIKKGDNFKVVRQSDHQAALAAAQADSVDRHEVKDSKALGEAVVAFKLMAGYSDLERVRAAVSAYFKALKGPEA